MIMRIMIMIMVIMTMVMVMIIGTSNLIFGKVIWDKLPESIFENFEIARVKRTKHMITG